MERPTIKINGEVRYMPAVKARMWREVIKFEEERKSLPTIDMLDKHCEIIAKIFGTTTDEVLDNLEIADVMPSYYAILNYIAAMLTEKIKADKKNEEVAEI